VEIEVQDGSPEIAASLANDIAHALIAQQVAALGQGDASTQAQLQQELTQLHNQITTTLAQINALPDNATAKVAGFQAQLDALEQEYAQWQSTLEQVNLTEAQNTTFLRVVQPAEPNYAAVRPDLLNNMSIGLLLGLVLGLLGLVLYELFDVRVHTAEAASNLLGWPLLGTIWLADAEAREQAFNPHGREMNAEAYRLLRTNLGFTCQEHPLRTLVVTSAGPGEGKSTIAANLAIFMARAGKNTLLIDADLRCPTLHTLFQLPPDRPGLSNAMVTMGSSAGNSNGQFALPGQSISGATGALGAAAQLALESYFHFVGVPNLRVMPSGPLPPNPTELLDSRTMQRLIALLATSGADIVIFDMPPTLGLADVSILATKVDGTLVVVDPAMPTRAQLKALRASLAVAGVQVAGCVVNRQLPTRAETAAFRYYNPVPQPQGMTARLSQLLLKKEYPSVPGVSQMQREKGLVHTAHHGRNP
jgi:non-specific protein-tyrosine kinase